jgi:DNA polymerase III alpha subunit (gram-positive type)
VYLFDAKTKEFHVFERVINVGKVPSHITKITGISQAEANGGVKLKLALRELKSFIFDRLENPLFVGHNLIKFDLPFINLPYVAPRHVYDTMLIERAIHANEIKRTFHATQLHAQTYRGNAVVNLKMCSKRYKIEQKDAHRAGDDARVTFEVFVNQIKKIGWKLFIVSQKTEKIQEKGSNQI